jgi:hypothetical protein
MPAAHELIYASSETRPITPTDLAEILAIAREKNAARGVTGMLLYEGGSFLQLLEGDESEVEQVFERISRDPRHHNIVVLSRAKVASRGFAEWSMGLLRASSEFRKLPGINDFLRTGVAGLASDRTIASRVLKGFREGRYRQFLS